MSPDEARTRIGRTVTWTPPVGQPVPVVIVPPGVIDGGLFGYYGPPRAMVHIVGFRSEFDVDPEELSEA